MEQLAGNSCVVCESLTLKYPCKHCKSPTCSLACFKAHEAACDGASLKRKREPETPPLTSYNSELDASIDSAVNHLRPTDAWNGPGILTEWKMACLRLKHPALERRLDELNIFLNHANLPNSAAFETDSDRKYFSRELKRSCEAANRVANPDTYSVEGDDGVREFHEECKNALYIKRQRGQLRMLGEIKETEVRPSTRPRLRQYDRILMWQAQSDDEKARNEADQKEFLALKEGHVRHEMTLTNATQPSITQSRARRIALHTWRRDEHIDIAGLRLYLENQRSE